MDKSLVDFQVHASSTIIRSW